jgi:hypothetical protein
MTKAEYDNRNATNYGRAMFIVHYLKAGPATPEVLKIAEEVIAEDSALTQAVLAGQVDCGS